MGIWRNKGCFLRLIPRALIGNLYFEKVGSGRWAVGLEGGWNADFDFY